MDFKEIMDLLLKGASLLAEGRSALEQVKAAVNDGSSAISATQIAELTAMLEKEELETKDAIADAREAIAGYRSER